MEGTRVRRSRRKRVEFDSRTMGGKDRRWNSRLIGGKRGRERGKKERKYRRGGVGARARITKMIRFWTLSSCLGIVGRWTEQNRNGKR